MCIALCRFIVGMFFCVGACAHAAPNIVLIIVDDLGQRDLGCYGSTFHETPNIDRLAAESMRFTDAYSAHPRCVPSRVGLLSGKFPSRLGQPGAPDRKLGPHALPLQEVSFGEAFREAGYRTAYLGKWHLGKDGGGPDAQGFERSIGAGHIGAPQSYFAPYLSAKGAHGDAGAPPNLKPGPDGTFLPHRLTEEAIGCIRDFSKEKFLVVLAHYAVHTPIEAPKELSAPFAAKAAKLPPTDAPYVNDRTGICKQRQDNAAYAAMVQAVDRSVGKVREALEALGIADNTLIILTSDHGGLSSRGLESKRTVPTTNLPYRHGKGWLYDGGTRVPFLVHRPGKPAGISDAVVTGTDIYPAMLDMAGLPARPTQHLDGKSFVPALDGKAYNRGPVIWHSPLARPTSTGDTNATAMRDGKWKIVDWYDEKRVELYDLKADPGEQDDLAAREPERTESMLKQLQAWREANARNANLGKMREKKKGKKKK